MKKFFNELKRRNVYKETLAYLVGAWLVLQVAAVILDAFEAPSWVLKVVIAFLGLGLPFWIFFSWTYQVTEDGIKKTPSTTVVDQSRNHSINKKLNIAIIICLIVIAVMFSLNTGNQNRISSETNQQIIIAVLPFENLSPESDNAWWGDAFTEDILTYLSIVKEIKVISRKSVQQYKNSPKTIPQIATELGVNHIVEGSVRKLGDEILVTAQLINAADNHLWANSYNEKIDDVFKLQQKLSRTIVEELKLNLTPEEEKLLRFNGTNNQEAYKLFNKALVLAEQRSKERLNTAQDLFLKALELDPNYADAYAKYAEMELLKIIYFHSENIQESRQLAQKNIYQGLSIDSTNVNALNSLAFLLNEQGQRQKAIEVLHKAIRLNPNHVRTLDLLALYYGAEGELEKQYKYLTKAVEVNPLDPRTVYMYIGLLTRLDQPLQAQKLYDSNSYLFGDDLVDTRGYIATAMNQDFNHLLDSLDYKLLQSPGHQRSIQTLASNTWVIERNSEKELSAKKRWYEVNPNFGTMIYVKALIKHNKANVLDSVLRTSDKYLTPRGKLFLKGFQSYTDKDWVSTLKYLDSVISYPLGNSLDYDRKNLESNRLKACCLMRLNKIAEAKYLMDSIFGNNPNYSFEKASIFAAMGNKDSMYYYLEKPTYRELIQKFRFQEFDPYFKEERFQKILKKHYLPVENYIE